ncbi:TPA: helix-turn-helix transcriptional regulator [Bacillus cereus]|nr:helix-turn-helix transcriptional regulator [Bacillus cereus]
MTEGNVLLFPKRLREVRKLRGLSQEQFAKLIGSKKTTVSNYETGYSSPSLEGLLQIGIVLGVSIDYLLGRVDSPTPYTNVSDKSKSKLNEAIKILKEIDL